MMKAKTAALAGGVSFVIGLIGTLSAAQAQTACSNSLTTKTISYDDGSTMTLTGVASSGGAAVGALVSAINTFNTAYVAQGSAFVANPQAKKEETGGGIWVRGIGGRSDTTFNSTTTFSGTGGSVNCPSGVHETYGGFQIGADVAKLNLGNNADYVHVGVTAGYGEASFNEKFGGTLTGNLHAPFVGAYATYAHDNFFADFMARYNTFTMSVNEPANLGVFGQGFDAHGYSLQGSAGYHVSVPNSNWFVEPSIGIIYSNTSVDTLNFAGTRIFGGASATLPGTLQINDLESILGRIGARFGTSFEAGGIVYQPFAAANVWHDFQGTSSATMNIGAPTIVPAQITVSNVTTYGQYSLGIAGQTNDGWVSYIRLDYRKGADIDALGVNGGLRYQFMPSDQVVAKGIFKAPPAPVMVPHQWAGGYVGGFAGASWGENNWNMISGPNDGVVPAVNPPSANVLSGAASPKNAGVLVGGQIGYNFRAGDWIFGPEADLAWTNQKGSAACPTSLNRQSGDVMSYINFIGFTPINGYPVSFFQCNNDQSSPIATLTGRIGHTFGDRVMVYAKAGGAWTHDDYSITFNSPPAVPFPPAHFLVRTASDDRFGWTVGTGFEFGITQRWSTRVEYDYLNFGSKTLVFADAVTPVTASIKQSYSQVKIGLNYRLGDFR
jgi:outer membrane autotransporter protein